MSANESENDRYFEELKSNYRKRIEKADEFSRHFSELSSGLRSQCLSGILDMLQYYVDLNKKFSSSLPSWYDGEFMARQSNMITENWEKVMQGIDNNYSQFIDYSVKNMRLYSKGLIQMMQYAEKFYDMQNGMPQISKNTVIEIIKEAKRANDAYLQKQFPVKDKTEPKKKIKQ